MKKKDWRGILQVVEVNHIRNKQVIWQSSNLKNVLHIQGEEYLLKILFSNIIAKPQYYYFGLDNRATVAEADTLLSLDGEPTTHNYSRQIVNSISDWAFAVSGGYNEAKSPILTFGAYGGSWGPIRNLFMTMQTQETDPALGYLISTVYLGQKITVLDGDSISMRMAIKLKEATG